MIEFDGSVPIGLQISTEPTPETETSRVAQAFADLFSAVQKNAVSRQVYGIGSKEEAADNLVVMQRMRFVRDVLENG